MKSTHFFKDLNYTLGNEDTRIEMELLPPNSEHVFTVAGSGSRVVPLLAKYPRIVTCADTSLSQLAVTQLRIETVRNCSHDEYLAFWGYGPHDMTPEKRRDCFSRCSFPDEIHTLLETFFEEQGWNSLLYVGRWERTFKTMSALNRSIVGSTAHTLFEMEDDDSHQSFLADQFSYTRWSVSLMLLGNSVVFNALLYRGHFPKQNTQTSLRKHYTASFARLFAQGPARKNFFLQMLFLGKIVHPEGLPIDCDKDVFTAAKHALESTRVRYIHDEVTRAMKNTDEPISFVSFSDVPSYFAAPLEQDYMQELRQKLTKNALVINRYYLRVPENTDLTGYVDVSKEYASLLQSDCIQMYTIGVYKNV